MLFALLVAASIICKSPAGTDIADGVLIPRQKISISVASASISQAATLAFQKARLKFNIAPRARALSDGIRVSIVLNSAPLDIALRRILVDYLHGSPVLVVRKLRDVFVLDLPTVTLDLVNETPSAAMSQLCNQVGCDHCIDVGALGDQRVTIRISRQRFDVAFRQMIAALKPPATLTFDVLDESLIVRPASGTKLLFRDPRPKCIASFLAHDRAEAVSAIFACFRQGFRISGKLSGTLTLQSTPTDAEAVLASALVRGPEDFTFAELDEIYLIVPISALGENASETSHNNKQSGRH